MEFGQRRRRLRGDLEREGDEFEGAYGRTLAQQSAWGRTRLAFRRVRREAPVVWDILIILIIVALALGADIYYISNNHKEEISSIEDTYKKQIQKLESKYKSELDSLALKSNLHKDKFIDEHASHTKDMRKKQKEYWNGCKIQFSRYFRAFSFELKESLNYSLSVSRRRSQLLKRKTKRRSISCRPTLG